MQSPFLEQSKTIPSEKHGILAFQVTRVPDIAIGTYKSIPCDVHLKENVQTQYGLRDKLIITHKLLIEGKIYEVNHSMSISTNKESRYFKAGKAIYDQLGRNFDWSEVINKPAQVEVAHYINSVGDVYEYIKEAQYNVLGSIVLPQVNLEESDFKNQNTTEVTVIVPEKQSVDEIFNEID